MDPDMAAVYEAEEAWADDTPEACEYLEPAEVRAYLPEALRKAGWEVDGDGPTVAFDVPDDHHLAGWHGGADHVIHLHPRIASRHTVLHELAHWLDDRDLHGPRFRSNLISLVDGALGLEAAQRLLRQYEAVGLDVDRFHLPDSLSN